MLNFNSFSFDFNKAKEFVAHNVVVIIVVVVLLSMLLSATGGDDKTCTALHKPTKTRLTVVLDRGGRYYVAEHGGRWYYSNAFTDYKCN